MKYFFFAAAFFFFAAAACAQTKDIIVKFVAGNGSMIDSIDIGNKTYYPGSLIKVPSKQTADVNVWVTCDNNGKKDTYVQLFFKNGVVSQQINFRKQSRKEKPRKSAGTFRAVPIANLEKIVLSE